MIEPIMYFGIGFLVSALLGLLFVPLVHNRAVRLTMRRLEAATPLSIAEIRADKDQLRAEFAMSTRRLEMSVDQMKAKTTTQLAELAKKSDAINQLKKELGEKTAAIFALESRDKALRDQLRDSEQEFELKTSSLYEAERTLADKETGLEKVIAELGERSLAADNQRVELAAARMQIEAMRLSVGEAERAVKGAEERLASERREAEIVTKELNGARGKLDNLAARTDELERQLVMQTTEAEVLSRRVHELEARLNEQGRLLAEREFEIDRLHGELEGARTLEERSARRACPRRQPQRFRGQPVPLRYRPARGAARRRPRRAVEAAARDCDDEARSRNRLGGRARRECAPARAHQRRRRGGGAPHRRARRPRVADRNHARRRGNGGRPGNGQRGRRQQWRGRRRRDRFAEAGQGHAGGPHPRAAVERLARRIELAFAFTAPSPRVRAAARPK